MRSPIRMLSLWIVLGAVGPAMLMAQEPAEESSPPEQTAPDEAPAETREPIAELVFEREVFQYPEFQRRNPFQVLLGEGSGPRFESMSVQGIVFLADAPDQSMVLMRAGQIDSEGQAQSRRLRIGETWGNVRIREIRRTEVLVEVREFGLTEQRTMPLPSRGQGGS